MFLIDHIGELLTMDAAHGKPLRGAEMSIPGSIYGAAVVIDGEKIVAYGKRDQILTRYENQIDASYDAGGALVTPGLVDSHTHAIFIGTRELDFEMRIMGKSYMEIAKMGGGIFSTTMHVRRADQQEIINTALLRFQKMLSHGITALEIKSGYGLETEAELRLLRAIKVLSKIVPQDVVATFLGAHEIPMEFRPDRKNEYIDLIINEMIPKVEHYGLAKFCDVFCEEGVFDTDDTRKILMAAKNHGLIPKLHADEIVPMHGAELGVELGAQSVDHLVQISSEGISALSASDTAAVLLPGTSFFLSMGKYAPARRLVDSDAIVALATDFNPGSSPTMNLPLVMSIACTQMKLKPAEAWAATTINAAYAIDLHEKIGSISIGKQADMVIWDAKNHRQVPYFYGEKLVRAVIKKGKTVWEK